MHHHHHGCICRQVSLLEGIVHELCQSEVRAQRNGDPQVFVVPHEHTLRGGKSLRPAWVIAVVKNNVSGSRREAAESARDGQEDVTDRGELG